MRIAMVSEHASPLAVLGGVDAGGQNVHVAALATALGRRGAEVVVHTRRDDPALPHRVRFAPGVTVEHVTYTDKIGYTRKVLRLKRHGVFIGDYRTVEELGRQVDVATLTEEEGP